MLEALGSVPGTQPEVKCRLKNPNSRVCNHLLQYRRHSFKGGRGEDGTPVIFALSDSYKFSGG